MIKVNGLNKLRNKEFSDLCEYVVAFELIKQGWTVYQPLIDRYIDIIATKKINGKLEFRTIQVKSSRLEEEDVENQESYGLTHEPKDLLHDNRHFFIWVFVNKNDECQFFIVSIKNFIDIRWKNLPLSTRRRHESLLRRGEWRHGTDRMHPKHNLMSTTQQTTLSKSSTAPISWTIERVSIDIYLEKWDKLDNTVSTIDSSEDIIESQEMYNSWFTSSNDIINKWKQNNKKAFQKLSKFSDAIRGSKKLDDTGFPEA